MKTEQVINENQYNPYILQESSQQIQSITLGAMKINEKNVNISQYDQGFSTWRVTSKLWFVTIS